MDSSFIHTSKKLLLSFLREPWGFSFFPSSFFWNKMLKEDDIKKSFQAYLSSEYADIKDNNNALNLYIHIPFCTKICSYCNCFKKLLKQTKDIDTYIDYLEREAHMMFSLNNFQKIPVRTIFIWWGTPNLLWVSQFEKLYHMILKYFDITLLEQFLIDGHPNYYSKDKISYLKTIGVNRLTFAVQSFDESTLKANNRETYNKNDFEGHIAYLKQVWIQSNIDLLIWLNWQTFPSIQADIDYLNTLDIDNVSVHYLMNSNNISYDLSDEYHGLIECTKKYLITHPLPQNSSNIWEDYYASKRNTTLSMWALSVTHIYWKIIYIKPWLEQYYDMMDKWVFPYYKWMLISKKDEMIKYIYLNILQWIDRDIFKTLFWIDIFKEFYVEMKYLRNNDVISLKKNILYSQIDDLKTFLYLNIFFMKKKCKIDIDGDINDLNEFFDTHWNLIDK